MWTQRQTDKIGNDILETLGNITVQSGCRHGVQQEQLQYVTFWWERKSLDVQETTKEANFARAVALSFVTIAHHVSKGDGDKFASREQIRPVENAFCMSFQAHQLTIYPNRLDVQYISFNSCMREELPCSPGYNVIDLYMNMFYDKVD